MKLEMRQQLSKIQEMKLLQISGWTLEMVSESIALILLLHPFFLFLCLLAQIQAAVESGILDMRPVADTVAKHTVIAMSATSEIIYHHCRQELRESEFVTLQLVSTLILFGHFLEARSTTSIRIVVSSLRLQDHLMDELIRRVQSAPQNQSLSLQKLLGRSLLNDEVIASAIFPEFSCYNLSNCVSNWTPRFMTE